MNLASALCIRSQVPPAGVRQASSSTSASTSTSTMMRLITPEDKDRVCLFNAQVFCSYEPMCKALGATVEEWVQQFDPIIAACCCSGLSYMIEQPSPAQQADMDGSEKDTIFSMSLALSMADYEAVQLPETSTFQPLLELLDSFGELPGGSNAAATAAVNLVWATHSSHMNKGYLRQVVEATNEAARRAGCRMMVADATNVVSQHLLPYFGYQACDQVRYHDYEPFRRIQCTQYVVRAIKQLAAAPEE